MKHVLKCCAVALMLSAGSDPVFAAAPAIVPLPQQTQLRPGVFTLCPSQAISGVAAHPTTKILADSSSLETGQYLAALLFKSTGNQFQVGVTSQTLPVRGAILITTNNANQALGAEGYELTVTPDAVVIRAPTA